MLICSKENLSGRLKSYSLTVYSRSGLTNRPRISDPGTVIDMATFKNPHQFAKGVQHVFVNGQAVLLYGQMTGARPGRLLKSQ